MTLVTVAAGVAVAAGAALQSAVGFGFALVCAPLLFAALSPEEAVGLLVLLGLEINLLTLLGERRRPAPSWADVWPVVGWSLPGSVAGVAILRSLDDVALQLLVTAGVLAALAANLKGTGGQTPRHQGPRRAGERSVEHVDEHGRAAARAAPHGTGAAARRRARHADRVLHRLRAGLGARARRDGDGGGHPARRGVRRVRAVRRRRGPDQRAAGAVTPSASGSWRRERTPSFRYARPRCVSTVFSVTNSACAISRLLMPPAAISATRCSLGVSASRSTNDRRGRAPLATSSACAFSTSGTAPRSAARA